MVFAMDSNITEAREPSPSQTCGHMGQHSQNDRGPVRYDARFDEYYIPAGGLEQCLFFCPWCGVELPPSARDQWFDAVEALGLDPWSDDLPEQFRSDAWRKAQLNRP
jgi:hypothetical protein